MEKELNIAAILKDKPRGIQLFDLLHNVNVKLDKIESVKNNNQETIIWCKILNNNKITLLNYSHIGTEVGWLNGLQILKPSHEMRDWAKFAWKKGDVLATDINTLCIFEGWVNDEYTQFKAKYNTRRSDWHFYSDEVKPTCDWAKLTDDDVISQYISKIEEHYGGKLNLDTLKIEKPQFKDGDIVTEYSNSPFVTIFIFKKFGEYWGKTLSFYSYLQEGSFRTTTGWIDIRKNFKFRLATDEEKQRLFDALANKNKAWDADKKAIVDLHKKCEFKPKDWCLMRFRGTNKDVWKLCQFGFIDCKDKNDFGYCAIGGNWFDECIPYNDQTAHLLGTTDDWKGGEE